MDNEDSDDEMDDVKTSKQTSEQQSDSHKEQIDDDSALDQIANYIVEKVSFLKTRDGRAAQVHNFLRGLDLVFNPKGMNGIYFWFASGLIFFQLTSLPCLPC